ncbi:carbon-nitrogen hydrolase family protein [Winogradskyella alexanderae]|uniref:Carbon-nitrogen hydrolase family protein n=1 Tax=Winogradskyella alexanderae TaxID=2877123 RepID=A0ABS7XW41_9FLAO|nr:carbon-nitrogen hydrolase family protein [Winogradskyella alexanderae]MCA0133236.1 carbon-nitrogen hydrolase family protein [Winogradskyella alexanderae]
MRICVAQTKSEKGNIKTNIENHLRWIEHAVSAKADIIVFPELSLTGYEPELAEELATDQNDLRMDVFQEFSNTNEIVIGVGLPTKSEFGILISMVLFQPNQPRETYSKQKLHLDEKPYFIEGTEQIIFKIKDKKIAPAICYESLQPEHGEKVNEMGADLYLASVAKSQSGIEKAYTHFPKIAVKYSMPVLMANCIGFCDNFQGAGQTSVWDENGILIGQLNSQSEGIIIYDTVTKSTIRAKNTNPNNAKKNNVKGSESIDLGVFAKSPNRKNIA